MQKFKRLFLPLLIFGLLAAWAGLHFFAPYVILQPTRVDRVQIMERDARFVPERVISKEGHELIGYRRKVVKPRAVIILFHGVGSSKEVNEELSNLLAERLQIVSFAFDNRGQGQSEGEFVTFGYHEKEDVCRIIDLAERRYPGLPIGLWGYSLGGAVALQALAIDERPSFAVIESTFARLDDTILAYLKRITGGFGYKWMTNYALKQSAKLAEFDPDAVQPAEAAKSITIPVFLAHGDSDIHIVKSNGETIFGNLASEDKELMIVEGADHSGVHHVGGEAFFERAFAFLERLIN
ncbi:hypothetical protein CEQ90_10305 [Lewinellaceae bacterium SD302]|nr:hypothetical protein CEQ90_10305 [Lewinellaceae bacterium SD302]